MVGVRVAESAQRARVRWQVGPVRERLRSGRSWTPSRRASYGATTSGCRWCGRSSPRASEMYARAKIGGYCHLNLGEEATVVGLMAALRPRDYLFARYRDHGYALMRGLAPGRVMAELFSKTTGVSGGRGGSMHMFDTEARLLGGYGIVGGQIPLATGAALALTYRGEPGPDADVVMCLLGDGATNIGAFHESLNLAGLWGLPIVYVIVNNGLGMGTSVEAAAAEPELFKRGCSYRIPGKRVDG